MSEKVTRRDVIITAEAALPVEGKLLLSCGLALASISQGSEHIGAPN